MARDRAKTGCGCGCGGRSVASVGRYARIALVRSLLTALTHIRVSPTSSRPRVSLETEQSHTLLHSQVDLGRRRAAWLGRALSEISDSCEDVTCCNRARAICLCPPMTGRQFHDNQERVRWSVGRSVGRPAARSPRYVSVSQSVR